MLDELRGFVLGLVADPEDRCLRQVFADWLEERGEWEWAVRVRHTPYWLGSVHTDVPRGLTRIGLLNCLPLDRLLWLRRCRRISRVEYFAAKRNTPDREASIKDAVAAHTSQMGRARRRDDERTCQNQEIPS
jgi:uncharacterized protein (TIGR02996 family)